MGSKKLDKWLNEESPNHKSRQATKREQEKKRFAEEKAVEDYEKALPNVLKEMRSGDWNKTYETETGSRTVMDMSEVIASLEEGLIDAAEVNEELGRTHTDVETLRERMAAVFEAVPGSSAAEEAMQMFEAAKGKIDATTAQVTEAASKMEELRDFLAGVV